MSKALTKTDYNFPGQKSVYHGKVRDVYNIKCRDTVGCYHYQLFIIDVIHIAYFSMIDTFLTRKIVICFC